MFMVAFLTLFAGMMSGLTVGYLSVDQLTMELRENTGTPEEKEASKVILPVLSNRHWLLCTLLLMNSFAMEALPVFLDRVFSRFTAVVISVTLLLIFGEVIPQALCTGPRQVQIAAMAAPMTRFLMIISWPITYWFFMFMVAFLTLFAGMMSGLTVGYLSVDQLTMELREKTGTEEEKAASKIILPVLSNRHWLLCTLLLMNSFAMEALPVFLDRIFSRFTAVVISVTLLLIFGEVIPQALCTGPRQIQIAAMAAPLTKFLMRVSWPITFWLGKCLDIILGETGKTRYQNQDLKCLVEMHTYEALKKIAEEEEKNPYIPRDDIPKPSDKMGLGQIEANIMISALEIKEIEVTKIMIKLSDIYSINNEDIIDKKKSC